MYSPELERLIPNFVSRGNGTSRNRQLLTEQTYSKDGLYTITAKAIHTGTQQGVLTLECDATFQSPGDTRELGLILIEAGLR